MPFDDVIVQMSPVDPGRLSARLHALLEDEPAGGFRLRDVFESLAGRGHAALLVVLSLPFCLPIPLLGLSTVFGPVLAFIGLRIAFARRPWLPHWVLDKPIKAETVRALAAKSVALEHRTRKVLRPRWLQLCRLPLALRSHGVTIAVLGLLLALPLPIPFTNLPFAIPILLFGLALLEDDGLFIGVGYAAAWIAIGIFIGMVWAGRVGIEHFLRVVGLGS